MLRTRVLTTAASVLAVQMLTFAPAVALERVEIDPAAVVVSVQPQDVEHARAGNPDGSFVIGGHLGARPGCPGVQAVARKWNPDGSPAWELSASAGKDCDLDGQPDGGDPLFAEMTSLDPGYILSSSIHDVLRGPNGSSYHTGQLLVGWEDGGLTTTAWGAFVVRKGPGGEHLADLYVGPQPAGSPAQLSDCIAICKALGETISTQWGGRVLAGIGDPEGPFTGLVLAGWRWSNANHGADDKDAFFVMLDRTLQIARWFTHVPYPGADMPLDVVVGDDETVYATGYYGPDHDVFVARLDGLDGSLTHLFVGGGPQDDWGGEVEITAAGEIEVEGEFTNTATLGGVTLVGDGLTGFYALLSSTLVPILIELREDDPGGGTGEEQTSDPFKSAAAQKTVLAQKTVPPYPPAGTYGNVPTSIEILAGSAGSALDPALVTGSDGNQLVLYGDHQPDHDNVEVLFEVPILEGASVLDSVEVQLESFYCTDLYVLLGGGDAPADVFYAIGNVPVCPSDKPTIKFGIPSDIAEEDLGFSAESQPTEPLLVLLDMEVYVQSPSFCDNPDIACDTPADDEKVDTMMTNSEFP